MSNVDIVVTQESCMIMMLFSLVIIKIFSVECTHFTRHFEGFITAWQYEPASATSDAVENFLN